MPVKPHRDFRLNKPYSTKIKKITKETNIVSTFVVDYDPIGEPILFLPGQFVMVWIHGIDEIPMSISHIGIFPEISISVAKIGDATIAFHALKEGDFIGIRGPYGNSYIPQHGTAIVVGGGIGIASVMPLIEQLANHQKSGDGIRIDQLICIEGAKTESELLFTNQIANIFANDQSVDFCTDDGSCGFKGFTTERLDQLLQQEINQQKSQHKTSPITVYACGPEIMLKKVYDICEAYNIPVQVSLERMMRCGFGVCGLCALEPTGLLVCYDGPIFESETLRQITDFGLIHREFSGKVKPI